MSKQLLIGVACIWMKKTPFLTFHLKAKGLLAINTEIFYFSFSTTQDDPEEAYKLPAKSDAPFTNEEIVFHRIDLTNKKRSLPDFDYTPRKRYIPNELDIQQLELLGIHRPLAIKSLRICGGSVERAADWAFNNWDTPTGHIEDEIDNGPQSIDEIQQKTNEVSS